MSGKIDHRATAAIKAYSGPTLSVYGDVKSLTASGTSGGKEGGTRPVCDGNLNKRPC
jgi:hypothetical protein